jgi:mannosyltransferase OCH1-like enzyme
MIPSLIHQIYITEESRLAELHDETIANTKSWQWFHPRYEHKLWNIDEIRTLARDLDPRILAAIDVCAFPAMKADIARLLIIFLHGGTYVDLKLRCIKPFIDKFHNHKLVLIEHFRMPLGPRVKYLINGFIIAQAGHEFIRRALDACVENVEARLDTGIWYTTGPKVLIRLQDEFLPKKYGRFENGVGVIRERDAYGKLFTFRGGGFNKSDHWHERQRRESIYTDCDVRYI